MSRCQVILGAKQLVLLIAVAGFLLAGTGSGMACPACWAGYGPGDERFNKPLADLRKSYEREGIQAIETIRQALQTSTDPLVVSRAADYIVQLADHASIGLLEQKILDVIRRVAFTTFGLGTDAFQSRLAAAHALSQFGHITVADQLWNNFHRLDWKRKDEIPFILNALKDPQLDRRMMTILEQEEDHQLMINALDVMALGGGAQSIHFLQTAISKWDPRTTGTGTNPRPEGRIIYYVPLKIKARAALSSISFRNRQ